jgi:bis(5'-nucleosidyl)-tetraphosphatase
MISFEKSVGAVVFRKSDGANMFLLLHYPPSGRSGSNLPGHWDFSKGHVEKGEKDEDTLRREIQEETGINDLVVLSNFSTQIRYFYRAGEEEKQKRKKTGKSANVMKKVIYYLAETKTKNIKISAEHIGFEWLGYKDALARITYKNGKEVLKKADKHLKSVL